MRPFCVVDGTATERPQTDFVRWFAKMDENSVNSIGRNIIEGLVITIYFYIFQLIFRALEELPISLSVETVFNQVILAYFLFGFLFPIAALKLFDGWGAVVIYLLGWFVLMAFLPSEIFTVNLTFQLLSLLLVAVPDLLRWKLKTEEPPRHPPLR
jgi:hypothetical protein